MAFLSTSKADIKRLSGMGVADYNSGRALTDEGLGDLRRISGDYRDLIRKGGLTDSLNRGYDVQQGRISDDVVRAGRSFRASLVQQAQQNGGFLSQAAQAELAKENEADVNEKAFDARNEVAFDKAKVQQEATRSLQDRILQVADMIRTTGLTRESQGYAAQFQALAARQKNNDFWKDLFKFW